MEDSDIIEFQDRQIKTFRLLCQPAYEAWNWLIEAFCYNEFDGMHLSKCKECEYRMEIANKLKDILVKISFMKRDGSLNEELINKWNKE